MLLHLEFKIVVARFIELNKPDKSGNYIELCLAYNPSSFKIAAVISCKITLRERIAQTAYWKLKLGSSEVTKNIKAYFVSTDEDGTLVRKEPMKKGRAIVEADTNGAYVMRDVEESDKVKMFDKFISDLKNIVNEIGKED